MHVGQWVVTPYFMLDASIMEASILPTNPALYWRGFNEMTPEVFPNVLLVDFIANVLPSRLDPEWDTLSAELQVLAIGLNLYLISENCKISSIRPPLLPSKGGNKFASGRKSGWNGVVFGNGTRLDETPPGFPLGCTTTLPKGTVFGNGTVLRHDVPNPGCAPPKRPGSVLPTFTSLSLLSLPQPTPHGLSTGRHENNSFRS